MCSWDILVLNEAIGVTFLLPGNTLSLLMLHSLKLSTSLIVSRCRLKVCLYLALLSLRILMLMMHILQGKRYMMLCRCTDDGHAPPPTATSSSSSADLPPTDLHLPIAIRKGTHVSTAHLIFHFVSYDRLYLTFRTFALSITSESIGNFTSTVEDSHG